MNRSLSSPKRRSKRLKDRNKALHGSFELNPLGCDTDVTGILAFEKVAGI